MRRLVLLREEGFAFVASSSVLEWAIVIGELPIGQGR